MPFMKVNLNGRKYVISGLTDDTTSKHILCSLARADPSFHLETTEFSDTSVENEERSKGTRVRRTRRTRVRQSSISSLEIVELDKKRLRGRLTQNKLIDVEKSEWTDRHQIANLDKGSKNITINKSKAEDNIVDLESSECSEGDGTRNTGCTEKMESNGENKSENSECTDGDSAKKGTKKLSRKFSFKDILKSVKLGHSKTEESHAKSQECHARHEECHSKCKECHAATKDCDTKKCHATHLDKCKECHATTKDCDTKIRHATHLVKCKDGHAIPNDCDSTKCHTNHQNKCNTTESHGKSSSEECGTKAIDSNATSKCKCDSHAITCHATNAVVKRRKRRTKKRPVSQDVTEWKGKKEERHEKLNELVRKRWKSADDIREPLPIAPHDKTIFKKHKTKRKSRHSHYKIDKKSLNDETISISSVDTSSEYNRVKRHARKDVGDLRIQRMISRTIDQRFVDFHVACMKSYACTPPENHHGNEEEIREKLLQLIDSQQKCLTALKKSEKQNKKAISRYNKYLHLDQDKIQFYGIDDATKKLKTERKRRLSETDTGISEMHSDSSTENTHTYQDDTNIDDVISDDFNHDDVTQHSDDIAFQNDDVSQCRCDSGISQIDDVDFHCDDVITPSYDVTHHRDDVPLQLKDGDDLNFPPLFGDDVISPPEDFTNPVNDVTIPNNDAIQNQHHAEATSNCVVTVDAIAIDDVTHDVKTYVYEKDDDTQSEIIVAQPTDVIGSATASSLVPYRSAESITMSTLSDISDSSFHGNGGDVEELTRVLAHEQQRQRELRRRLERQAEEIRLMELRIKEHEKMADILGKLKDLNHGVVEDKKVDNKHENDFEDQKDNLEKSKQLSVNLYEYQKSEISKNSSALEQIESQIRRKRWHVDSAVRELDRLVSSFSQSKLDRIRSFEQLPASFAGLSIRDVFIDETLV